VTSRTKRIVGYVLAGAVCFFIVRGAFRLWDIYDSRAVALGIYKAELKAARATEKVMLNDIKALNKKIDAQTALAQKYAGNVIQDKKEIVELKEEVAVLNTALSSAKNDRERVIILTNEVNKLNRIILVAEDAMVNQGKEIDAWAQKYNFQVKISADYKAMWEAEKQRADACDDLRKDLERDLRICRLTGGIKTGVVVAAAGAVAYLMVKGK